MHLRTKLSLGITAAALATFVGLGYVAVVSTKAVVRDRVDEQLLDVVATDDPLDGVRGDYAVLIRDGGQVAVVQQSGAPEAPDEVPIVSRETVVATGGEVGYLRSGDGRVYRATAVELDDGRQVVVAAPADDVTRLVRTLILRFWLMGVSGSVVIALASYWWIRRSTRPVEQLTGRAEAIAAGSSDRSLAVATSTSELRQLSRSLTAMIASIDAAMAAKTESEERLRRFVADASHELRTPLTTVSGYLQLDADGALADGGEHHRAIHRALGEAHRMRRIVADLQLLAELDGEAPPVLAAVDVAAVVADAVADGAAIDPARRYLVTRHDRAVVVGDADRLRQVVTNLLANVRTHTPPGSTARVEVGGDDGVVSLRVVDDGPGVADDALAHVFDRFWREDLSRSRATGGSGLGLAIVASIVGAHGGAVAASRTDGGGLTIDVRLPAAATAPTGSASCDATRGGRAP